MVLASVASSEAVNLASVWPIGSREAQRRSEATQSAAVTGWPSCHFRPGRSTKV